jgi:hypothetical protein
MIYLTKEWIAADIRALAPGHTIMFSRMFNGNARVEFEDDEGRSFIAIGKSFDEAYKEAVMKYEDRNEK